MKNYKNDYDRKCFLMKRDVNKEVQYYLKVGKSYIEVSEEVFKVCRRSFDKIRKDEINKVNRSILNYQDIDQSTFFSAVKDDDIINQIYLKDISNKIKKEIMQLSYSDRKIAYCIFIQEFSDRETSRVLNIPQTTITYRKRIIRKKIEKNIHSFCSFND